ncbi:glycosyltransferase [uncultured Winogradskyella sp.]|uniref:glycosyltransferase n=1 Tax=uncultured Winogradskyella sp. TaxID=395353 RepID=UPI00263103DE|nr:glycosyltransferase [uncultured Winogradskyella sp.]
MKVLLVNTYDKGGAAKACLRLHNGLLDLGIDSKVVLRDNSTTIPNTYQFSEVKTNTFKSLKQKFSNGLRKVGILPTKAKTERQKFLEERYTKGLEFFSFPDSHLDITKSQLYKEADIINLHWVANFMDYASFFKKNTKPVVWTLHDMNPFTGGEHYKETIQGMDALGFPIQRTLSKTYHGITEDVLRTKQLALQNSNNLHIVTLCNWMTNEVKANSIFKQYPLYTIPNGIDSNIFKLRDKIELRNYFNIPKDKTVLLFIADSISNRRKGYAFLQHALHSLARTDVVLCAVGKTNGQPLTNQSTVELGEIKDEVTMSKAYAMADVFVIPSLMDNLPNTVIESLLCGTPVIGFPVGGITDMITDGKNGFLTKSISSTALKASIMDFLAQKEQFNRKEISQNAKNKYDITLQSKAYAALFHSILN